MAQLKWAEACEKFHKPQVTLPISVVSLNQKKKNYYSGFV